MNQALNNRDQLSKKMNSPEKDGPMSARANEDLASYLHVNQVRREIVIDGCGEKVV